MCIWRPYDCRQRAGCPFRRIAWDRRCHTGVLTGLLIVPVENKDNGKVWIRRVPRGRYNWGACLQRLVCLFTILPGVPAVGGSAFLHGLEMSCEYGQTRSEDENMEADRNKRGLGGEARGAEGRGNAASDGGPKVLKKLCWHGGQRPFS